MSRSPRIGARMPSYARTLATPGQNYGDVAQVVNLLYRRFAIGCATENPRPGAFGRMTECNSAIQQIKNLRYDTLSHLCPLALSCTSRMKSSALRWAQLGLSTVSSAAARVGLPLHLRGGEGRGEGSVDSILLVSARSARWKICATSLALFLSLGSLLAAPSEGQLPVAKDGHPLKLDFEDGTVKDGIAVGKALEKQPVKGDTVVARRSDMRSDHHGNYWIGTFEISGDQPKGTLTSAPFKVTQPYASFLVAGGSHSNTRVELVRADDQKVIFKTSGYDGESLRPVVADLRPIQGKEIFIRIIDQESGGWGHINFDDFRLYAERPKFANELAASKDGPANEMPPMD